MARTEIARLHAERERYEETMKKAFMRGVCALNLEAMSMFREGEEGGRRPPQPAVNSNGGTFSGTVYDLNFRKACPFQGEVFYCLFLSV